jgi:hypothetical protein
MKFCRSTTSACLRGEQRVVHSPVSGIPQVRTHGSECGFCRQRECDLRPYSRLTSPVHAVRRSTAIGTEVARFLGGDYLIVSPSAQRPRIPPRGCCRVVAKVTLTAGPLSKDSAKAE